VEIVRRVIEAFREGDPSVGPAESDLFMGMLAADIVWDLSRSPFPEARVYHGLDGVQEWLRGLVDAFEDISYETEEITDLGDERVLLVIRVRGHGQFSKIDVDYRFAPLFTFRDAKVVRMDRYESRSEALKAVGLED